MKKFIAYLRSAMLIIVAMGSLISCGNDFNDMMKDRTSPPSGGETPLPTPTPPPSITLSSISVKIQPTRIAYGLNSNDFDFTDMELTLKYSDGSTQDKIYSPAEASLYSVTNFDRATTGSSKTADVTYGGVTTTAGGNITGLGVHNLVAKRGISSPFTYYGYDTLQTAFGSSGESGKTATITMYADENITSGNIAVSGSGTDITLTGNAPRTITGYNCWGNDCTALFTINSGASLTLGTAVSDNTITITGHTNSASQMRAGGGVYVYQGTFIMNGGTISGNTAYSDNASNGWGIGGGVHVGGTSGSFTMNGGTISGNTAKGNGSDGRGIGGGVGIYLSGTFTMNGGTISNNNAVNTSTSANGLGGGVGVYYETGSTNFVWNGTTAEIIDNTNSAPNGKQVYKNNSGIVSGTHGNVSSPTSGTNSSGYTAYWD
ncbi:hypothetical protein AGMMS50229_00550 [Campylobacterota bacterium]|nr:hypothetical protein AGMMS50229_00550 [Campylobacterota bacterium]